MTKKNVGIASVVMSAMIAMLLLVAGSSRVTASDQPSPANVAVKIDNFVFGPQAITVPVGTTVTWTNSDDIPHTAVSKDGVFKSKVMDTGRKVLLHVYQGRNVFLLLLGPSENDRSGRGEVSKDCLHFAARPLSEPFYWPPFLTPRA